MPELLIPRTLHFIWVGDPMPDHLVGNLRTWRDHHPEWDVRVWSDEDLTDLDNQHWYNLAEQLVPADAVGQIRSDIARYEILWRHGGFYADVDTYPLRDITPQLAGHSVWAAAEDAHWVGNTYLASVPEHPLMRTLIDGIPDSIKRRVRRRPNVTTGPKYITPLWRSAGAHADPAELWFPYSYRAVRAGDVPDADMLPERTVCVHQWQHTRDTMQRRREREGRPGWSRKPIRSR